MIVTEQLTINDRQFAKTYSDSGFMVEREGSHNNKHWISAADNNIWEPGVYGWSEEV